MWLYMIDMRGILLWTFLTLSPFFGPLALPWEELSGPCYRLPPASSDLEVLARVARESRPRE